MGETSPQFDAVFNLGGPANMFCATHLEPLRARWPYGYAGLLMVLFQHALRDHEILRACGWKPELPNSADVDRLSAAIREFGPICCRLPEGEMERWTALALAEDYDAFVVELRALEQQPVTDVVEGHELLE